MNTVPHVLLDFNDSKSLKIAIATIHLAFEVTSMSLLVFPYHRRSAFSCYYCVCLRVDQPVICSIRIRKTGIDSRAVLVLGKKHQLLRISQVASTITPARTSIHTFT